MKILESSASSYFSNTHQRQRQQIIEIVAKIEMRYITLPFENDEFMIPQSIIENYSILLPGVMLVSDNDVILRSCQLRQ